MANDNTYKLAVGIDRGYVIKKLANILHKNVLLM